MLFIGGFAGNFPVALRQAQPISTDVRQRLAVVLAEGVDQPRIDTVRQQQHLDALVTQLLQVRARGCCREVVGEQVVNSVLAFLHTRNVIVE